MWYQAILLAVFSLISMLRYSTTKYSICERVFGISLIFNLLGIARFDTRFSKRCCGFNGPSTNVPLVMNLLI